MNERHHQKSYAGENGVSGRGRGYQKKTSYVIEGMVSQSKLKKHREVVQMDNRSYHIYRVKRLHLSFWCKRNSCIT